MRIKRSHQSNASQSTNRDRQATVDAYVKAYSDGARSLAARIETANSGENLHTDWQSIDFEALREGVESLS